ncbi:MAG: DNA primase [Deltaproteobacteria bacterium]|jgi:DNA primase|nr:DNA primase [Deltaproteobacteria bacterium]
MNARRGFGSGDSAIQAIKDRLNIADLARRYVNLQRVGHRWMAPCPFHQETKPSFSVDEERGSFYCFGCQASGDLISFYQRINGLDFKDALEQLAQEAGVSLRDRPAGPEARAAGDLRRNALKMHEAAKNFYARNLASSAGAACRDYLARRALDEKIIQGFELGWSLDEWGALAALFERSGFNKEQGVQAGLLTKSDHGRVYDRFRHRLMFPIKDLNGRTIAFGGRIIDNADEAKYINSADSPLYKKGGNLYGLFQARRAITLKKSVLLTEGYMDVLTLHQFGYQNSCGALGTALTPEQVKRLAGFCSDFELLFDGDGPGRKAAMRAAEMLMARGLRCKVTLLPEGEDIDSLLKAQGTEAFERLRRQAPDGLGFCMRVLKADYAPKDIVAWTRQFLASLEQPEYFSFYASELAQGLGMEESLIRRDFSHTLIISAQSSRRDNFAANAGLGTAGAGPAGVAGTGGTGKALRGPAVETQVLDFLARYPQYAARLREAGAEFVFATPRGLEFWAKIMDCGPDFAEPDILASLDDKQRAFWTRSRDFERMPASSEKERLQLEQICSGIERLIAKQNNHSRTQVLSQLNDDDYEVEVLKSLHEKLTGKPLVESKNE